MLDLAHLDIHDWRQVTPEVIAELTPDELLDAYAAAITFICRPALSVAASRGWTEAANMLRDEMRSRMSGAQKRKRS